MPRRPSSRTTRQADSHESAKMALTSGRPIYQQIASHIRSQIDAGQLSPGDRVPSVRELASELAIAPATVARSLRMLIDAGVLEAKVGSGTRVAMRRPALRTLGILGNLPFDLFNRGPYFRQMLMRLQMTIISRDWTAVYAHCPLETPIASMFDNLSTVDGVFQLGDLHRPAEHWQALRQTGKPVFIMGGSGDVTGQPVVDTDHIQDSCRAVTAMFRRGHRHVAFIAQDTPMNHRVNAARCQGYVMAHKQAGVALDDRLRIQADIPGIIARLRDGSPRPTAALMASGVTHIQDIHHSLLGSESQLGSKLLICAYDEHLRQNMGGLGIEYWRIEQPIEEMADQAVDAMMWKIEYPEHVLEDIILTSRVVEVSPKQGVRAVPEAALQEG